MFMTPIGPKTRASARGQAGGKVRENATFPRLFLTFAGCGGLTPPFIEKTFFSNGRPALETGGQRPTARCALGRKSVWNIPHPEEPRSGVSKDGPRQNRHPSRRRLRLLLRVRQQEESKCSTICRKSLAAFWIG